MKDESQSPLEPGLSLHTTQLRTESTGGGSEEVTQRSSDLPVDVTMPAPGLLPPALEDAPIVTGATTETWRKANKIKRIKRQMQQNEQVQYWRRHTGQTVLPSNFQRGNPPAHRNKMCPSGLALQHPAGTTLLQYATQGCPTLTGKPWTRDMMQAAVDRGPHQSALAPDAIDQLTEEVRAKVAAGQARIVDWKDICDNPPPQLKISPISMIPHKSRKYRTILDLSFSLRLEDGGVIPSVNEASIKSAPKGSIDQIGHSLSRIIHAMAEAPDDAKVFMAKWDIKDGFWRMDCEQGEEWNFAYILPEHGAKSTKLVVPQSLQMGWIESPPYFCAASETARDVAELYINTPVGQCPTNHLVHHSKTSQSYAALPETSSQDLEPFRYLIEVYVDDFMGLATPTSQKTLDHVANSVMCGIHDVFPTEPHEEDDPISLKKLLQQDGAWDTMKDLLGFVFNGEDHTMWLTEGKRDALLQTLSTWLRSARKNKQFGIPFNEFRSVLYKVRHAFMSIPAGKGLLSPFYKVLSRQPRVVFLQRNQPLQQALQETRTFLRDSITTPNHCRNLVTGWPDYVGVCDASKFGVGGIVVGELKEVPPTVFRVEWPMEVQQELVSEKNPRGSITNSDLECAGLVMVWLLLEAMVDDLSGARIALYSDNSPSVSWIQRLASRRSQVAMQLIRALALRLQLRKASPLTTLHIAGVHNQLTDVPSRSFGSNPAWACTTDTDFSHLYNSLFPLPDQSSWNVFRFSNAIVMKIISVLRTRPSTMDEWRRLPRLGRCIGPPGPSSLHLWAWIHTSTGSGTNTESERSPGLRQQYEAGDMAEAALSQLQRSVRRSRPLARRSPWPLA